MESNEYKQKMRVAPPYQDRKSKEFELVSSEPPCTRCGMRTTWSELESGQIRLWCMNCAQYMNTTESL